MRSLIIALLVFALLLPAFLPIAPHKAAHALYDAHVIHHVSSSHHNYGTHIEYFHDHENDFYNDHENFNHGLPTDFASYYKDFLHIELKKEDQNVLISKIISAQDIEYDLTVDISQSSIYELKYHQKRGPPLGYVFETNFSSLYLTTLRLRI